MIDRDTTGCSSNTLWIISVSILAGSLAFSIVICIAFDRIPRLRRFVYGFVNMAHSINHVEKMLKEKMNESSANVPSSPRLPMTPRSVG